MISIKIINFSYSSKIIILSAVEHTFSQRLADLDACSVSDAEDLLELSGAALGLRALSCTDRIAGPVVTLKLTREALSPSDRHLGTAAIEASTSGNIIAVEHAGRIDVAGWGGVLAQAAKLKGIAGIVIDGACRDVEECRLLGLPIYARGAVPVSARGRIVEESFNREINICGIRVQPGDYVIADANGVVFIPKERTEQVIQVAEEITAKESQIKQRILEGQPVIEALGRNYEAMLRGTSDKP
jgi:regulator of RNase E activity RraA